MNLTPGAWALLVLGALLVGISKTGLSGLGLLFVALFAAVLPARQSTGVVLPLLIVGDVAAFCSYRRHAAWTHVLRLLPWAGAGVVAGAAVLGRMNDHETRVAIGALVLGLTALHLARRAGWVLAGATLPAWFAPGIGILAGFATLVANASGPLMVVYLLAMGLPKLEFVGTGAVFFLVLNLFKVPFMVGLGLIGGGSLELNLLLAPAVLAGTVVGRWLLGRINPPAFENVALALTLLAGARMLL